MTVRRTTGIFAIAMLLLALDAVPAGAHDPVFLSEEHTSPEVVHYYRTALSLSLSTVAYFHLP